MDAGDVDEAAQSLDRLLGATDRGEFEASVVRWRIRTVPWTLFYGFRTFTYSRRSGLVVGAAGQRLRSVRRSGEVGVLTGLVSTSPRSIAASSARSDRATSAGSGVLTRRRPATTPPGPRR